MRTHRRQGSERLEILPRGESPKSLWLPSIPKPPAHPLTGERAAPDKGIKRKKPVERFESAPLASAEFGLMSEHALFEYRAKLMSTPHVEEQGEPVHCLIKMEIGAGHGRSRELLEQEAGDLILFSVNPGPHRRISHSSICEVDEKRLRELGPATDFNRVGGTEIYFYSS